MNGAGNLTNGLDRKEVFSKSGIDTRDCVLSVVRQDWRDTPPRSLQGVTPLPGYTTSGRRLPVFDSQTSPISPIYGGFSKGLVTPYTPAPISLP